MRGMIVSIVEGSFGGISYQNVKFGVHDMGQASTGDMVQIVSIAGTATRGNTHSRNVFDGAVVAERRYSEFDKV